MRSLFVLAFTPGFYGAQFALMVSRITVSCFLVIVYRGWKVLFVRELD
jgi:hypothetical protein